MNCGGHPDSGVATFLEDMDRNRAVVVRGCGHPMNRAASAEESVIERKSGSGGGDRAANGCASDRHVHIEAVEDRAGRCNVAARGGRTTRAA